MTEFSRNEIIEMAVQIERRGLSFYEAIQKVHQQETIRKVFEFLAGEERRHIAVFEGLRSGGDRLQLRSSLDWEDAGRYLKALVDHRVFPEIEEGRKLVKTLPNELEATRMAISIEKDNILFFYEIFNLVGEKEKKLLEKLIEQEKGHICRLLDLRTELNSP